MRKIPALRTSVTVGAVLLTSGAFAAVEDEAGGRVPPDLATGTTPSEYNIPPVNPKSLKNAENHPWNNKEVKNLKGETLGTIDHVMVDTKSGKDVYAMLKLGEAMQPMPIPLAHIKESETGLILNASKEQLQRGGPNLGGQTKSQDFQHQGSEPLNPSTRQGGS